MKGIGSSSSTCMGLIRVRLGTKGKDFASLGCGTYFIEYNAIQYSTYSSNNIR